MSKRKKNVFSRLFVLFIVDCDGFKVVFIVTLDKIFDTAFYFSKIGIITAP